MAGLRLCRIELLCVNSGPFWFDVRTNDDDKIIFSRGQYYPGFHQFIDYRIDPTKPRGPVILDQSNGEVIWSDDPKNDRWHFQILDSCAKLGQRVDFFHGDGSKYEYTMSQPVIIDPK